VASFVIRIFKGLDQFSDASLIGDRAQLATNVDIEDGKLNAIASDTVIISIGPMGGPTYVAGDDSISFFSQSIRSSDYYYGNWLMKDSICPITIEGLDIVVLLNRGERAQKWVRYASGSDNLIAAGLCGQAKPWLPNALSTVSVPVLYSGGNIPAGEQNYAFTLIRNVGGMRDESEPVFIPSLSGVSIVSIITTDSVFNRAVFPAVNPPSSMPTEDLDQVEYQVGYRLYNGQFREFSRVYVGSVNSDPTKSHKGLLDNWPPIIDDKSNAELGEILPSFFKAPETGDFYQNELSPELDGIAAQPFADIVFGWNEDNVFWTQKNQPDTWHPTQFFYPIGHKIRGMVVGGDFIAAVTDEAVYVNRSTSPYTVQFNRAFNTRGSKTRYGMFSFHGLVYFISYFGVEVFDGTTSKTISDKLIPKDFFDSLFLARDNVAWEESLTTGSDFTVPAGKLLKRGTIIRDTDTNNLYMYNNWTVTRSPGTYTTVASSSPGPTQVESRSVVASPWTTPTGWYLVNDMDISATAMIVYGNKLFIAYRDPSAIPWNSKILVWDFVKNDFTVIDYIYNSYVILSFFILEGDLYVQAKNVDSNTGWYPHPSIPGNYRTIWRLFSAASSRTMTWKSGQIMLNKTKLKEFKEIEVQGSGTVAISVWLDGVQVISSKAINFNFEPYRRFPLRQKTLARQMEFQLVGTGRVTEVTIHD